MRLDELDREIEKGARAIAKFYCRGAGISLDDAVYEYLEWFDLTQNVRKLRWKQMAATLKAAGACRENGEPFTEGHLSGVVSRQRKMAEKVGRPPKPLDGKWELSSVKLPLASTKHLTASREGTGSNVAASEARSSRGGSAVRLSMTTKSASVGAASQSRLQHRNSPRPRVNVSGNPKKVSSAPEPIAPVSKNERQRTLAFMTRAANLRGRPGEDR
jgi:hypothetical protein